MLEAAPAIASQWEQVKHQLPGRQLLRWIRRQESWHSAPALVELLSATPDGQVDQMLGRGRREGLRTRHLQPDRRFLDGTWLEGVGGPRPIDPTGRAG